MQNITPGCDPRQNAAASLKLEREFQKAENDGEVIRGRTLRPH